MQTDFARTVLETHRNVWREKPVLRDLYQTYFDEIRTSCISGRTLEVGCGCGNFRQGSSDTLSLDIVRVPWQDIQADAHRLPLRSSSLANIVMIDVLHHLEAPGAFLEEAQRVLIPGGRIILVEPAITPFSRFVYSLFHREPVLMGADPFTGPARDSAREPFDANQAVPTLLFFTCRERFRRHFPGLEILRLHYQDMFAFPLSGGFRPWCLLPRPVFHYLFAFEQRILPVLGPYMAFRLFCVLEKRAEPGTGPGKSAQEPPTV